jgi:hypothetical protein
MKFRVTGTKDQIQAQKVPVVRKTYEYQNDYVVRSQKNNRLWSGRVFVIHDKCRISGISSAVTTGEEYQTVEMLEVK